MVVVVEAAVVLAAGGSGNDSLALTAYRLSRHGCLLRWRFDTSGTCF